MQEGPPKVVPSPIPGQEAGLSSLSGSKGSTPLAPNPAPALVEGSLEAAPSAGGLSPGLSPLPLAQSPTPPLSVHCHLL